MFDVSFMELLVVAVVALVVIGPERLPETVRNIALWIGRLRRMASRLYREVEQEMGMDDVRRQLHNEEILRAFDNKPEPPVSDDRQPSEDDVKRDKPES
ncbi:MAG: Sec-independent protein translocase protein TatB [Porticoccaceae bacterium]